MTHMPLTEARAFAGLGEICISIVRNHHYNYAECLIEDMGGIHYFWIAGKFITQVKDMDTECVIEAESWVKLYAKVVEYLASKGISFT